MKRKLLFVFALCLTLSSCGGRKNVFSSLILSEDDQSLNNSSYVISDFSSTEISSFSSSLFSSSETSYETSSSCNSSLSESSFSSSLNQSMSDTVTSVSSESEINSDYTVRYYLNGGSSLLTNEKKCSFSVDYVNEGYWEHYQDSIFIYDNENENKLGAKYALRISLDSFNLENEYIVKRIYLSGESDYNENPYKYTLVVHYDNTDDYALLSSLNVGDTLRTEDSIPSSGASDLLCSCYKDEEYTEKKYKDKIIIGEKEENVLSAFNISYFNEGYWDHYQDSVFLYDNSSENALGALYSLRIGISENENGDLEVKHIYAPGESDKNENPYTYTIVCHSANSEMYAILQKIETGNLISFGGSLPSSSGNYIISCRVLSKDYNYIYYDNPKKTGYIFEGFYESESFEGSPVLSFDKEISLYAKWKENKGNPYTLRSSDTIKGYGNDVSYYQGTINFSDYKSSSSFMIARIGYSASSDVQFMDSKFLEYVSLGRTNNIPLGLYIYSEADSVEEAQNEAEWIISSLEKNNLTSGVFSYPLFIDYENSESISSRTRKENTDIINAYASVLSENGYYPGVYIGGSNYKNYVNASDIDCDVWIASYYKGSAKEKLATFFSSYPSEKITMWQFDDGSYDDDSLSGETLGTSSTYVDQDYVFVDYPSIIKNSHYNGF